MQALSASLAFASNKLKANEKYNVCLCVSIMNACCQGDPQADSIHYHGIEKHNNEKSIANYTDMSISTWKPANASCCVG